MDELKKRIEKTNKKVFTAGKEEQKKYKEFNKGVNKNLKISLLNNKALDEIKSIRDFIKKYKK